MGYNIDILKTKVLEEGGGKYRSIYRIDAFLSINIDVSLDWIHLHYFSMYGGKLYYAIWNVLCSYFSYRYKDMIFKSIDTIISFLIFQYFFPLECAKFLNLLWNKIRIWHIECSFLKYNLIQIESLFVFLPFLYCLIRTQMKIILICFIL